MSRKLVVDWKEMYNIYMEQNVSLYVIGQICGCNPTAVSYNFKKLGFAVREGKFKPFKLDVSEIVERYNLGESAISIAESLNVSIQVITDRLKAAGVKVVNSHVRKLYKDVDLEFFSRKDEWSAYTYGLLLSDGCLYKGGVSISLQERDLPTLTRIAEMMGISSRPTAKQKHRTGRYKKSSFGCISFRHPTLVANLIELGMEERKSTREVAPECFAFDRHFWRGMMDGDGSLFMCKLKGPVLTLCGSETICTQFLDYCKTIVDGIKVNVKRHKGELFSVKLTKNKCLPVARALYQDQQLCLERKYKKYLEFEEFFKGYQYYKHTVKRKYKNKE